MRSATSIAFIVVAASGCDGDDEDAQQDLPEVTVDDVADPLPAEARLGQLIGVSLPDLQAAVEGRRIEAALECMNEAGFRLSAEAVDSLSSFPAPPPIFGGNVEAVLAGQARDAQDSSLLSAQEEDAFGECLAIATREIPDPLGRYDEWLSTVLEDLAAAVSSDTRWLEARRREATCIRALGFESGDSAEPQNDLIRRTTDLIEDRDSGTISEAAYEAGVSELLEEEATLAPAMRACIETRLLVERQVRAEVENDFLGDNAEALREVANEVQEAMSAVGVEGGD